MNQRVLSSSSMMLKGVTLKSSDWREASAAGAELHRVTSNPRLRRNASSISISTASSKSSQPRKMSSQSSFHRSNSSFQQLQRLSSSSLASMASGSLASRSSNSGSMGNATWDTATKPESTLNMFDLKISEPKSSNPFLDGTYEKKAPRRSSRTLRSDLLPLQEDFRCSFKDKDDDALSRSSSKRSLAEVSDMEVFVVPTFQNKVPKKLDTRTLSTDDLEALHKEDAFMYYSIPEVRRAVMEGRDVDFKDIDTSRPVKRCSAISYESADIMDGLDFAVDDLDIPSLGEGYFHASVDSENEDMFMSIFD